MATQPIKPIKTHRMSNDELQEAVYVPNKEKQEAVTQPQLDSQRVTIFTLYGKHDTLTNELGQPDSNGFPVLGNIEQQDGSLKSSELLDAAYAKSSCYQGRQRFFIKENGRHELMNPVNGLEESFSKSKQLKKIGLEEFRYREVNHTAFMLYLNFLKTQRPVFLRQASREAY